MSNEGIVTDADGVPTHLYGNAYSDTEAARMWAAFVGDEFACVADFKAGFHLGGIALVDVLDQWDWRLWHEALATPIPAEGGSVLLTWYVDPDGHYHAYINHFDERAAAEVAYEQMIDLCPEWSFR